MKKEVKIAGIIIAAVIIVGLVVLISSKQPISNLTDGGNVEVDKKAPEGVPESMLVDKTPEAAKATQDLINDLVVDANQEVMEVPGAGNMEAEPAFGEDGEIITPEVKPIKMVVVAPGTSPINVETGKVINTRGEELSNEAGSGTQGAPQASFPMDIKDVPKTAIKLEATSSGFSPSEFTVNRGQAVSLAVTNVNESTFSEILRFDDPALAAIVIGVSKGETISLTFNAPDKAGEYTFFSDMFNHRDQGAEGKMIVK